jgi:hypothetical protein
MPEAYGDKPDEWIATRIRMLMRTDLEFEPIVTAARDRIMRLHRQNAALVASLGCHAFASSDKHLSGYRLTLGFDTLEQVQAAHQAIVDLGKALATREGGRMTSRALPGEHYCAKHQGNTSHYAPENCTVCRLTKALTRYGAHEADCMKRLGRYACTCGFEAALKNTKS